MIRNIIKPKIIKRLCHTHSKINLQENISKNNNHRIEQLINKQNDTLNDINYHLYKMSEDINTIKIFGLLFGFLISIKP